MAEVGPCALDRGGVGDAHLAAAVVAAAVRFHEERTERLAARSRAASSDVDVAIVADGKSIRRRASASDATDPAPWRESRGSGARARAPSRPSSASGPICSISSVTTSHWRARSRGRVGVVERRGDDAVGHGARRAIRVGIEHVHVVAERARGHRGHAAELASAENADRRTRRNHAVTAVTVREGSCWRAHRPCASAARRAVVGERRRERWRRWPSPAARR